MCTRCERDNAFPTLRARCLEVTGIDPDLSLRLWLSELLRIDPHGARMDAVIRDGNRARTMPMDYTDPRYQQVKRKR